jgi:hypothetical protein
VLDQFIETNALTSNGFLLVDMVIGMFKLVVREQFIMSFEFGREDCTLILTTAIMKEIELLDVRTDSRTRLKMVVNEKKEKK